MVIGCGGAAPPTACMQAAFEGRTLDVLAALERGEGTACDALVWAARGGQPDPILAVTARGVNPDRCRAGVNGWTPLMHAVHKNRLASVEALIRAGANVNGTEPGGHTPLMMAAGNGNLPVVERLLAAGADVAATTPHGVSALTIAVSGGAFTDIENPLLGACRVDIVRALAARAPDVRVQPTFRWKLARLMARLNGCESAFALVSR